MPVWKLAAAIAALALLLGCGQDDPQAALDSAAQSLQDSIESKDNGELMARIHPEFFANPRLHRDWAGRTAALMFLRHGKVRVIALNRQSWIDPTYPDRVTARHRWH